VRAVSGLRISGFAMRKTLRLQGFSYGRQGNGAAGSATIRSRGIAGTPEKFPTVLPFSLY